MSLDASSIDRVMDVLRKRREQIALGDTRRKNVLMSEFIDEMITRREDTIRQAQHELSFLKHDRQTVQVQL